MPFEVLAFHTRAKMPPTALVSYMRPAGRGKNAGRARDDVKPQLVITLPTTICGLAKAKAFALSLGSGKDAGKLRITGCAADDGVKPAEMRHSFRFNFGYVPKLGDDIFDGERRDVRKISDDVFEIDVPAAWFEPASDDDGDD